MLYYQNYVKDGKALAHGYRTLQNWNHWLAHQSLGARLLEAEQALLTQLLNQHYGKHALLIGVPEQQTLLNSTVVALHSLLSPLIHHDKTLGNIESDFHELPILTGSIDLVMLPHTLEFVDHPQQLLREACRIVKPEGLIAVTGFNPMSAWGLRKQFARHRVAPWTGNFMKPNTIKTWLSLVDFEMETRRTIMHRPPFSQAHLFEKLSWLEKIGSICFPMFGGVYVMLARAKVVPLTPIRMSWKQQLSGLRISSTIPGHIVGRAK